jgi:hypothetical protein
MGFIKGIRGSRNGSTDRLYAKDTSEGRNGQKEF